MEGGVRLVFLRNTATWDVPMWQNNGWGGSEGDHTYIFDNEKQFDNMSVTVLVYKPIPHILTVSILYSEDRWSSCETTFQDTS